MSVVYLIFLLLAFALLISALIGLVMFIIDVKRFSSYKSELDNLMQKYSDKLDELEKLQKSQKEGV